MNIDTQSKAISEWRAAAADYLKALTGLNVFCLQHELLVDEDMQQILHNQGIVYNPTRTAETLTPERRTKLEVLQQETEQAQQKHDAMHTFAPEPGAEKEIKRLANTAAAETVFGPQNKSRSEWRARAADYLNALMALNVFCLQRELSVDSDMHQTLHKQGIVYNPTRTAELLTPEDQRQLEALQQMAEQVRQKHDTLSMFAPEPEAGKEIKRLADMAAIEAVFGLQSNSKRSWTQALHSPISRQGEAERSTG